jgi:hypothetical protein
MLFIQCVKPDEKNEANTTVSPVIMRTLPTWEGGAIAQELALFDLEHRWI